LSLPGAAELIAAKVRLLVVAAGSFGAGGNGPADARIQADIAGARQLFSRWPSPIVAVGTECGAALPFPGRAIETEFAWAAQHPIAAAYRAYRAMPYDAPSPAAVAALYLFDEAAEYFRLSEPGRIEVLDGGGTKFTPSPGGKHWIL